MVSPLAPETQMEERRVKTAIMASSIFVDEQVI